MRSRAPLEVIRRRWRWVVLLTLLGVLGGIAFSQLAPKSYRTSGSVFFSLQYGNTAADLVQGSTYAQNQVASFARLATTPAVLGPVIDDLGLKTKPATLAGNIEATAPLDTVIVEVAVTYPSARDSARIADAVIAQLSRTVESLAPRNDRGQPTVDATTVAFAEVPRSPAAPNPVLDVLVGLAVGLVLGLAIAWAREALDNRVRDASVVTEVTDLPVIGTIAARSRTRDNPVVIESDPQSAHADFFRQLGTNLQFLSVPENGAGLKTMMVTSSLPAEGKSTVAANLAAVLAETGARVVLVDADLRRPSLARHLGLEGAVGLSTVLVGRATLQEVTQEWGSSGLHVLASGRIPPNSSELLNSAAMRRVLAELRSRYDYVVLDAAPLLPVADAVILSRAVDGTILIANVTRVRRHQLTESLRSLRQVKARVLGIVLNQVRRRDPSYSYEPYSGEVEWVPVDDRDDVAVAEPRATPDPDPHPSAAEPVRAAARRGSGPANDPVAVRPPNKEKQ